MMAHPIVHSESMLPLADIAVELARDGCVVLPEVLPAARVDYWRNVLTALDRSEQGVFHRQADVYAARNVLQLLPEVRQAMLEPPLPEILSSLLGHDFGLVRALYFDKPPGQTWALPWHKDLKIAVRPDPPVSTRYSTPRDRAGVLHAEAPLEVLESMLTVRIHLDAMTASNGALVVLPGSHTTGKSLPANGEFSPRSILGNAGDLFLMRPLLAHCSGRSLPESQEHRRILHLEFSSLRELPDGWEWHDFVTIDDFSKSYMKNHQRTIKDDRS